MGDTPPDQPPPQAPTPDGAQLPAVRNEVDKEAFVETFTVREKGRRYDVAVNAVAAKAQMQVDIGKLRAIAERALEPYLDGKVVASPKELKILAEAVQAINDMMNTAYSKAEGGSMANALERLVYAAAKGGASGIQTKNTHDSADLRLKRLSAIGKAKVVEAEVLE